eukprot:gene22660-26903_t
MPGGTLRNVGICGFYWRMRGWEPYICRAESSSFRQQSFRARLMGIHCPRVAAVISHVFLGTGDFDRAFAFYSKVMAELGLRLKFCDADKPWAGWVAETAPRPIFVIGAPFDGNPSAPGNGQMVGLLAPSREAVRRSYTAALALGGICLTTTPIITARIFEILMATSCACAAMIHKQITLGEGELNEQKLRLGFRIGQDATQQFVSDAFLERPVANVCHVSPSCINFPTAKGSPGSANPESKSRSPPKFRARRPLALLIQQALTL